MSSLPCHEPIFWKLFRNESIESQERNKAIKSSHALADSIRRPQDGLWWDAQRHVDQVIPAEFVSPADIDTATYRYQVFARPPPLQCPPNSLQEVTDARPPIRYNVKRVAVEKPFPPSCFECSGHWSNRPFRLQRNQRNDCSGNNNTRSTPSIMRGLACLDNNAGLPVKATAPTSTVGNGNILCPESLNQPQRTRTPSHTNANNANSRPPCARGLKISNSCESVNGPARFSPRQAFGSSDVTFDNRDNKSCNAVTVDSTPNKRDNSKLLPTSCLLSDSSDLKNCRRQIVKEGTVSSSTAEKSPELVQLANLPPSSARSTTSQRSVRSSQSKVNGRDQNLNRDNSNTKPEYRPLSVTDGKRLDCLGDGDALKLSASRLSLASTTTRSSVCSTRSDRSTFLDLQNANIHPCASKQALSNKSRSRGSIASLLSSGGCVDPPPFKSAMQKRHFAQPSVGKCDSVASLLSCTSNDKNNSCGTSSKTPTCIQQDPFTDLIVPTAASCNMCFNVSTSDIYSCKDSSYLALDNSKSICSPRLCSNNNAKVEQSHQPGVYTMQCFPVEPCGARGHSTCQTNPPTMFCRFQGQRPDMSTQQPACLKEIKSKNPIEAKMKDRQRFECFPVTSCATGKSIEGPCGDLVLCKPVRPTTPEIGYNTYKIIASKQFHEKPDPLISMGNISLPPDLEEYREFTKRCPNFKTGRYDRWDPLNEMLLPGNRLGTQLRGANNNPFVYNKMPRRKLPPLFEPLKVRSDLKWGLPSFVASNDCQDS